MIARTRSILSGFAREIRALHARAILEVVPRAALPRAIVRIDGALTRVARVAGPIRAPLARSCACAAASTLILPDGAVGGATVALVSITARVVARARAILVRGA